MELENNGKFVSLDFKVSSGSCSGLVGAAILCTGLDTMVDIRVNHSVDSSPEFKVLVGFAKLRVSGGDDHTITASIKTHSSYADANNELLMYSNIQLPSYYIQADPHGS